VDAADVDRLGRAIARVRSGIADACARSGRTPDSVTLVAVTKSFPIEVVRAAADLGLRAFGENHADDLARKAAAVTAQWHYLGKLQTGTAPRVADWADLIHSGEPGRALERVVNRAARQGRRVRCLLQVDFTGHRQGVDPHAAADAAASVTAVEGVELVGLMTLPPFDPDPESARPFFRRLHDLRDGLRARWPQLAELSMGMSGDYEVAVEEGATMVRVGTALFGARPGGRPPSSVEGSGGSRPGGN
jgi:pyridoxal phosphate enzyme (YggS family)